MIIGIDGNEANVKELVGVSVYTLNLLYQFKKQSSSDLRFTIYLKKSPLSLMPSETENFTYEIVPGSWLWSQIFLPLRLLKDPKPDVFFAPAHYAPRFLNIPLVVTIHDLAYFYYPNEFLKRDLYKLKNWTNYSIKKAQKIIAVSENTKRDLNKFYGIPHEKITVIYNGFEKWNKKSADIKSKNIAKIKNPYILYVGTLQPRKNVTTLLKTFARFSVIQPEFKLVLVGKKGWLYDEIFSLVGQLNIKDKVIFTGYVENDKLEYLYKNAYCLVLPSLYEGFGIPILEAMSYGCPIIASNTSSLPEVGGSACLYFDPTDESGLLEQMKKLKSNTKLREELIEKGFKQFRTFSWEETAKETLKVLTSYNAT